MLLVFVIGALWLDDGLSLRFFLSECIPFTVAPCDAGREQADESFAAGAAQPHIPEEAPAFHPEVGIPRLEHPLITDEPREAELYRRLQIHYFGRPENHFDFTWVHVIDRQMRIDRGIIEG